MPRFEFIEDERFPADRSAALMLADRIAAAIRGKLGNMNERGYRRYAKYMGCDFDLHHGVLIQGLKTPSRADPKAFGFMARHPEITFFEGLSEAPDEVATGPWLRMLADAGVEFSLVHARFLAELPQHVTRSQRAGDGEVMLCISRQRLPLQQRL